ncbi:hypothetical protein MFFC18_51380 [Mariniblastus fucicola]|uniref:Uncharacterized protein n=2 Tax=Mariniblastus fucicola TaxID=980251 RepID=A0A5B9PFW4_9BACT|nr:hypothetical protein MFFC18_51380 [Mariniblastus fucicola]
MRLAIFLGCIVSLILISRWYSVGVNQKVTIDHSVTKPVIGDEAIAEAGSSAVGAATSPSFTPEIARVGFDEPVGVSQVPPEASPAGDAFKSNANRLNRFRPVSSSSEFSNGARPPVVPQTAYQDIQQAVRANRPVGNQLLSQPNKSGQFVTTPEPQQTPEFVLGDIALNVQSLVRAEYEVPKEAAEILMQLEPDVLVEITERDSGRVDTTILRVTADQKTQLAYCSFLAAMFPIKKDEKSGLDPVQSQTGFSDPRTSITELINVNTMFN